MSTNKPTYDELQARCDDLQGQVIRFLKVEQDLINTRNSLDLDLARFKAIQSYSQKVIQAEILKEFAEITVELVVETFEVECSIFFLKDKTNGLKVEAFSGIDDEVKTNCILDVDWIASRGFDRGSKALIEKVQPGSVPIGTLGLSQVILSPYYDDNGNLHGMLMGGISVSKKDYYDEIKEEMIPSFMVFTQQMSSLLRNFEAKQYLDLKVQQRTAQVVKQKQEIEEINKELRQQQEELKTTNEVLEDQKEELQKTLDFLYENKNSIHAVHRGCFLLLQDSVIHRNPKKFSITKLDIPDSSLLPIKYDVWRGMKPEESKHYLFFFDKNYFNHFSYFSEAVTLLRHHALLLYSNHDSLVFNIKRETIPLSTRVGLLS